MERPASLFIGAAAGLSFGLLIACSDAPDEPRVEDYWQWGAERKEQIAQFPGTRWRLINSSDPTLPATDGPEERQAYLSFSEDGKFVEFRVGKESLSAMVQFSVPTIEIIPLAQRPWNASGEPMMQWAAAHLASAHKWQLRDATLTLTSPDETTLTFQRDAMPDGAP